MTQLYPLVGYLGAVLKTLNDDGDSTFLYNMHTYEKHLAKKLTKNLVKSF